MSDKTQLVLIQFASALSTALKERDPYTRYHSDRVMSISAELGKHIGLSSNELTLLKAAAALHDIGKIGVPDDILLKPATLEEHEMVVMQTHSERGANIVFALEWDGTDVVANAILHHHECFDGSGYPHALKGEDIPILSRIITIADNYDAMSMRRVYHEPKTHVAIIDEMLSESGYKHDPALFELFLKLIDRSEYKVH